MERDLIKQILGDKPVAYHPILARLLGSATAALYLSQMMYWDSTLSEKRNGWFWKSMKDVTEETGLNRHEQDKARAVLKEKKILQEEKKGLPYRLFYRIDWDVVIALLSSLPYADKQACHTPTNKPAICRQTISENTTENTAENTTEIGETKTVSQPEHPCVVEHKARIKEAIHTFLDKQDCKTAVDIWRAERGKNPPKEAYPDILNTVGDAPADLELWRQILHEYSLLGWNRQSVSGALNWFRRREIPHVERQQARVDKMEMIREVIHGNSGDHTNPVRPVYGEIPIDERGVEGDLKSIALGLAGYSPGRAR